MFVSFRLPSISVTLPEPEIGLLRNIAERLLTCAAAWENEKER